VNTHHWHWSAIAAVFAAVATIVPALGAGDPSMADQMASNRRLAAQIPVVERAVEILQQTKGDYNGDIVRAVSDLDNAESDLRSALRSDGEAEPAAFNFPYQLPQGFGGISNATQVQSDEVISDARTMLDLVIGDLQGDAHDYGGFRVRAIADVQQARDQLDDALHNSDRNVVATAGLLDHAIAVLQSANQDYGGHRSAAVSDIQQARNDLTAAMNAANISDYGYAATIGNVWEIGGVNSWMSQSGSDDLLRNVQAMVASATDNLQHDSHDYNGYRAQAVAELQVAANELDAALATR
jgi:hypothetical protein